MGLCHPEGLGLSATLRSCEQTDLAQGVEVKHSKEYATGVVTSSLTGLVWSYHITCCGPGLGSQASQRRLPHNLDTLDIVL